MICSPTTRSEYEPVEGGEYAVDEVNNITCISYKDSDPWGEYINGPIYNQRIDWLLSLRKYDVSYVGEFILVKKTIIWAWNFTNICLEMSNY